MLLTELDFVTSYCGLQRIWTKNFTVTTYEAVINGLPTFINTSLPKTNRSKEFTII